MNGSSMWPKNTMPHVLPPIYERQAGRPKNNRTKNKDKKKNPKKLSKKY